MDDEPLGTPAQGSGEDLAQEFAEIARELLAQRSVTATLQRIAVLLSQTIEGCDHAGVTMVRGNRFDTVAASDDVPPTVEGIQYEENEGPCLDAIHDHEVFTVDELEQEERWPRFGPRAVAETGIRSILSFRLFSEEDTIGALNLYSRHARAFDEHAAAVGSIFAAHAAVAFRGAQAAERAAQLEQGLESRDVIGQAKGIVMAHRHVTPDEAFTALRQASQRLNLKLRDVAQRVAETGQDPGEL